MNNRRWEAWEDAKIIEFYQTEGLQHVLKLVPNRTVYAVKRRARDLGVASKRKEEWRLQEIKALVRCYPNLSLALRSLPGRTISAIKTKSQEMGLPAKRKTWRPAERQLISKLYLMHSDAEMGAMLGRTAINVAAMRGAMSLSRPVKRKFSPSAVLTDLRIEAKRQGRHLKSITALLGKSNITPHNVGPTQTRTMAKVVEVLGGELYAEWDDDLC